MRGVAPVTIRTADRRLRSGPNLLPDLESPSGIRSRSAMVSSSTTQDSMGKEWMMTIYQRYLSKESPLTPLRCVRGSESRCILLRMGADGANRGIWGVLPRLLSVEQIMKQANVLPSLRCKREPIAHAKIAAHAHRLTHAGVVQEHAN